jgi:4a-hydroxytetrahydrobiopterin dehydratase
MTTREPLAPDDVAAWLAAHPAWTGDEHALERHAELPSFRSAVDAFVAIADAAEELDHHPDVDVRWRTLTFRLSTHSAGGRVTQRDLELAARIDDVLDRTG